MTQRRSASSARIKRSTPHEGLRPRYEAPEASQDAFQGVEKHAGAALKAARRADARQPPQERVEITGVDPLADEYSALREEFRLARRGVRYVAGEAETLAERFPENHFDLVYCRNALDHSRDPLLGIRQMIKVLKAGGCCWLTHSTDEGEKQRYRGLHRWNFSPQDDGDLVISAPAYPRVTLRQQLRGLATVQATKTGNWHTVIITTVPVG